MSRAGGSTEGMTASQVDARAAQAHSFLEAARLADEFSDDLGEESAANVITSMAVLAGIAAADAICGKALGVRSKSSNHSDAVSLLNRAHDGVSVANQLRALIDVKSAAAYEPQMVTKKRSAEALKHAERLIAAMQRALR